MNLISGRLEQVIDDFIPEVAKHDIDLLKRMRMFVLSHLFGPFLGLPIPVFLWFFDPQPYPHVPILAASILMFWPFLFLLKRLPNHYLPLALVSILDLNFAILWGSYHYGGASSPFLMWYMLLPMLAFFYLGSSRRSQVLIFAQIVMGLGTFFSVFLIGGHVFPRHIPIEQMVVPGILSAFCSTTYAFFMAAYYAKVVESQSELVKEVERHERTLEMLTMSKEEIESANSELQHATMLAERRNAELLAATDRLEFNALHDALTGLPNRRYLDEVLAYHAEQCGRLGGSIGLLHIDLDRFKQINDTLGHVAGDAMLVHVAKSLKALVDSTGDFVARVGGDEFVVVCRLLDDPDKLTSVAANIIAELSEPVPYQGHLCRFGACIGIAVETGSRVVPERLLVNSDIALYRAKGHGRNRVEYFSEELQAQIVHNKQLADDILRGLEENEFTAFYQPQIDANTFEVVGVEALVRWQHPTKGILAPGHFIGIAEELNVVSTLDQIVLERALADMAIWDAKGVKVPKVAVNVSARRLNEVELVESVRRLQFEPGRLAFELVESIFLDELEGFAVTNIEQIKELGVDIEIDDFGTGHASIVSLLRLNPKKLKIDRQFIAPANESPELRRLVRSIVEIGHSLDIQVVAEGVETLGHAFMLRDLGCDILQGYAFSRPVPSDELEGFIARRQQHTRTLIDVPLPR